MGNRKFTDRLLLARSLRTDSKVFKLLSEDAHPEIRWNIARLKDTPQPILNNLSRDADIGVRRILAENPMAPAESLEFLANDLDDAVVFGVATNPSASAEALKILHERTEFDFSKQLAKHNNTSTEVLIDMTDHNDKFVRRAIANNLNSPPEVLEKLGMDIEISIRKRAFQNLSNQALKNQPFQDEDRYSEEAAKDPNTAPETLRKLSTHARFYIRKLVAMNPSTPEDVLINFASKGTNDTKFDVLCQPKLSMDLIKIFLSQPTPSILSRVLRYRNVPQKVIDQYFDLDGEVEVLAAIASNPKISAEKLELLAHHECWRVACNVAQHPSTPDYVLAILADRNDHVINSNIAIHSKTPVKVLKKLADDRSKTAYSFQRTLALFTKEPSVLEILANNKDLYVLMKVVENEKTPNQSLRKLAQHKKKRVRMSFFEVKQPHEYRG